MILEAGACHTLHWRHNGHDGVSNHQPHDCLLNRLFWRRSKKTSKLRVTGLCVGNSPGPVNSPHKGPVTRKMFPFDDVIMTVAEVTFCIMRSSSRQMVQETLKSGFANVISISIETIQMILSEKSIYLNRVVLIFDCKGGYFLNKTDNIFISGTKITNKRSFFLSKLTADDFCFWFHILIEWLPFCRRHFRMLLPERKL